MSALTLAKPKRTGRLRTGGPSLGLFDSDLYELISKVETGFSFAAIEKFQKASGLSLQTIARMLLIPQRTLVRRRASGRLAPDESERLLRIARVFENAVGLFEGDVVAAKRWLSAPKKALGGKTPFDLARTEIGGQEVEALIGRLEHGVFS
jgi:putative toxin-antitoxin system antitoxin component (TIGR02293 family)